MKLTRVFFSFRGRLRRTAFWWGLLAASVSFVVLFVFLRTEISPQSTLVLYPPYLWIVAALCVKRLHDRGKTPVWLLAAAIPVLGALWLFVDLALRRGTPGENQYGPDPREFGADYLTVK
jgi:uncharacterized membrane protein YhaH (DUF805 family)